MWKKKLLVCAAVVIALIGSMICTVMAEESGEARIGTTYYSTLEAAVAASSAGDTVVIVSDVVLESTLFIEKGITLTTDGVTHRTISGTPSSSNYLINVKTAASTLSGVNENSRLVIDGGNAVHDRALVCLQAANSSMRYVTIQNNISTYSGGGGLYTNKKGITVEHCTIADNQCRGTTGGGGVYLTGTAEMIMQDCTISGNVATASGGGGFVAKNGVLTLTRCAITNNRAQVNGGSFQVNGQLHPTWCTVEGNYAPSDGTNTLLSTLPAFQGTLLGYVDGSYSQEEAVYQLAENGDTYATYSSKLISAGYALRRTKTIDGNTYGTFTNASNTVTLMDTPTLKEGTVRIVIEPTNILPNLNSPLGQVTTTPAVSMLGTGTTTSQNGMCFIYRLSDGRFLVVDGGYPYDDKQIYDTLKVLAGSDEITIAAWFLTHAHNDHVAAFVSFWENDYSANVTLQKVIYNFPGESTFAENIITKPQSTSWRDKVQAKLDGFPSTVECIKAHPGQVFTIGDAEITMLYSAELMSPDEVWNFNDTSLIFTIELSGLKFLQLADCARAGGEILTEIYSEELASDVLQVAHHGHYNNSVNAELYQAVAADYAFWPSTEERYNWTENRSAAANIWLFEQQALGNLTMWCAGDYIRTYQMTDEGLCILPVAQVGSTYYATLGEAVEAALEGSTIVILRPNVLRSSGVTIDKSLILTTPADTVCQIVGAITVDGNKTVTISGGIEIDQVNLINGAKLYLDGILSENAVKTLNVGDFAAVQAAASNQTVYLTGDVAENYLSIELANSVNPDNTAERYILYGTGTILADGEARIGNTVYTTLEQAISAANSNATIVIMSDVHLEAQLRIEKNLTLASDGYKEHTITSAYTGGYALFVTGSANTPITVQLQGTESGKLVVNGDGILRDKALVCSNYATTTLSNVVIKNGNVRESGAGLYVTQGSATLNGCCISNNNAVSKGGGIYVTSTGGIILSQSQVLGNHAAYGGGIYGANSSSGIAATIAVTGSLFEDNTAANRGGGIYGNGDSGVCCNVSVQSTTFRRNLATTASSGAGGAICLVGPKANCTLANCVFENNAAAAFGGAVTTSSSSGRLTLDTCVFTGNTAGGTTLGGGAVCCGTLVISGGTTVMTGNVATTSNGGAICLQNTSCAISNGASLQMSNNSAVSGSGDDLCLPEGGIVTHNGSIIGSLNFYVIGATAGSSVLTGSNVSAQYSRFIFDDSTLSVSGNGTLCAA